MDNTKPLLETNRLTKRYGQLTALDDCSLTVQAGSILGLLGPNGAGKSTLLRLLMGYLRPTLGSAAIAGLDCHRDSLAIHRLVSYLPGDVRLLRNKTGLQVLKFFAALRGTSLLDRGTAVAKRLGLEITRPVAQMSTGMRQKLALAVVLAAETSVLILDEPTSNLDPSVRTILSSLIREAKAAGRTIIFSSHVLSEVEQTCDRAIILRRGIIVHDQNVAEVRLCHHIRAKLTADLPAAPENLAEHITIKQDTNREVTIETTGELAPVLQWLATLPLADIHIEPLGLQRVYQQYHPPEEAA